MRPPTPIEWRADAELRGGHLPSETLAWHSAWEEFTEGQQQRRALPATAVWADAEPRGWRRLFGR